METAATTAMSAAGLVCHTERLWRPQRLRLCRLLRRRAGARRRSLLRDSPRGSTGEGREGAGRRSLLRDSPGVAQGRDARALADGRCSGRRSCRISVPDQLFDGTTPCPEDLKLYLMADYTCVKGAVFFFQ